jgi:ferredoxin/flavodoxin---NADP+ reductase
MASVAIIGAGPSGCFVAQALLKLRPDAAVTIFDALPVPYGLVRYGVAPDHQGTKAVTRQFDRLFDRQGVVFAGNVTLGRDVTLDQMRAAFDAVVLATGLHDDRNLGIPGEGLAGVHGAGAVTRAWNGWPGAEAPGIGARVVVVGNGNVAIDLVRLLAKTDAEMQGADLAQAPGAGVTDIQIVGRSPAMAAKFDPVMLRELGKLTDCVIRVIRASGEGKVVEALAALDGHAPPGARKSLTFRFGLTPRGIEGDGRVERIVFDALTLDCDTVITAIGFQGDDQPPAGDDGFIAPGLYAAGWRKRGPRGTIPENRADAQTVAARIAADLPQASDKPGLIPPCATDFTGWQRIDAAECAAAPPGRVRAKITTLPGLLALARNPDGERP